MRALDAVAAGLLDGGVASLIIALAGSFGCAFIGYTFMGKLLSSRANTLGLMGLSLVYALWYNLRTAQLLGTAYHLGMNLFINLWTACLILFLFRGRLWQKIIVYWYFDIIKTLCEAISFVPFLLHHTYRSGRSIPWAEINASLDLKALPRLAYTLAFLALFLLAAALSLRIWRKLLLRRFRPFYVLLALFPMGQMYALAHVIHPNMGDVIFGAAMQLTSSTAAIYYTLALAGIMLCAAIDLALLAAAASREKRADLEKELQAVRRAMELEQAHYRELDESMEALAKIRHDFNNQLASITQLIRLGEVGPARELIASLGSEIDRAR